MWDGVFIGEYPSPSSLTEMNKLPAYATAHVHRENALCRTELYAIPPCWLDPKLHKQPRSKLPLPANWEKKDKAKEAVMGEMTKFKNFVMDKRFGDSPVWMLNFLKYELGDGAALYSQYGAVAESFVGGMTEEFKEATATKTAAGIQLYTKTVVPLKGSDFDSVAIMRYPSRQGFLSFSMIQTPGAARKAYPGEKGEKLEEAFKFRQAGLAVQGLVAMLPGKVYPGAPPISRL